MNSCVKQVLLSERIRHFSLTAAINKSHYDSLGVTPKSTHNDIKNAYYKLSMLYHPDKNQGSDVAANKFRDITAAYEVLGNLKLRKLYDKGLLPAGTVSSYKTETVPENKFYESRERRSKPPAPTGKTDVYNFDEWTRAHYAETFERSKQDRVKQNQKAKLETAAGGTRQSEVVIYSIIAVALVFMSFYGRRNNLDTSVAPKRKINPDH